MLEGLTLKYLLMYEVIIYAWFMSITCAFKTSLNFGNDKIEIGLQNYDFIFLLKICRMQLPLSSCELEIAD